MHPSELMNRPEALRCLWLTYRVPDIQARDLLDCARESASGMAPLARPDQRTIWATHMTTQGEKFIIELA